MPAIHVCNFLYRCGGVCRKYNQSSLFHIFKPKSTKEGDKKDNFLDPQGISFIPVRSFFEKVCSLKSTEKTSNESKCSFFYPKVRTFFCFEWPIIWFSRSQIQTKQSILRKWVNQIYRSLSDCKNNVDAE